ncbi:MULTISPECIES: ABC transporter permease [Streptococcus]|uniref:ABC transporter permease n=1 Tax=Streptococcus caledonicus TaxID=2614158 RepID=A0ABW0UAK0_9STRE|nr:ABC transporter permease [Streptococcus sp. S784/96/1]
MRERFIERRQAFHNRCLKYLKYVFNDHFVLVLIFLLGFLLYQYRQLLDHFPTEPSGLILVLSLLILGGVPLGSIATFIEPADQFFILTKEKEVIEWIRGAANRTFVLWGTLEVVFLLLLYPILVLLGISFWGFVFLALLILGLKYVCIQYKLRRFITNTGELDWREAIAAEQKRRQSLLKFFALFTTVKGISSSVKRRTYLDVVTKYVEKTSSKTWCNLYLRAFLRSGDYLGLALRLMLLSLVCLFFVKIDWLAVGLAFLFTYLLAFQLLALYGHYDYQYMTELFPLRRSLKKTNLLVFLKVLIYGLTLVSLPFSGSLKSAALLLVLNFVLIEGYLRYKVKKMID